MLLFEILGWPEWFVALAFAASGILALVLDRRMRRVPELYAVERWPRWQVGRVVAFGTWLLVIGPAFLLVSVVDLIGWLRST